jgi:hypothetical protein
MSDEQLGTQLCKYVRAAVDGMEVEDAVPALEELWACVEDLIDGLYPARYGTPPLRRKHPR